MKPEDFFSRLNSLLEKIRLKYGLDSTHDAFVLWFGEHILMLDPEDVIDRIVGDAHAEGVDSILMDSANLEMVFLQAKTVKDFTKTQRHYPEKGIKKYQSSPQSSVVCVLPR